MKYRKKPVIIEAFKWTGDNFQVEDPAWAIEAIDKGKIFFDKLGSPDVNMRIQTLEGIMRADRGDWIIKGVKGEIYPCKTDVFEATYEKVEV